MVTAARGIGMVRDVLLIVVLLAVIVLGVRFLLAVGEAASRWETPPSPVAPAYPLSDSCRPGDIFGLNGERCPGYELN